MLAAQDSIPWNAKWITSENQQDTINAWTVFRKEVELNEKPSGSYHAGIAVDSKYWLWVNGEMVVREGGLKRGPTPQDTYFDTVNLTGLLYEGNNVIAVLVQYFGKHGFSHKSSGQSGLIFDLEAKDFTILSDSSWKAWPHPSFGETGPPHPNFRLPESNVLYDVRKGDLSFVETDFDVTGLPSAVEAGAAGDPPWNKLFLRPIPLWKDFGLKSYENALEFPFVSQGDTVVMELPYNAQITPYFHIESGDGDTIDIRTDHYFGGGPPNVRHEYVTRNGNQEYECFGWINGHHVRYYFPEGVKILDLKYRETGYDTDFSGSFTCDDPYFNTLWQKALRTLYITMRDTYMDCPDRERAQWWGDEVLESGEAFYALSRSSDELMKKGMLELVRWQRPDSTLFSPVPAGNWHNELPGQMLASVGYYGFYNYYWHTGDLETIRKVYEPVKRYLDLWKILSDGTVEIRQGGWMWGDWGENKDIPVIINTQYYLALKGLKLMAEALGKKAEAVRIKEKMASFKAAFNQAFWQGDHYRSSGYEGQTDDRSQGLAVVSGLADPDKYDAIYAVLQKDYHASPYMEKYIIEALFQMGYPDFALQRLKERFHKMVTHSDITTLWEGWGIGSEGFGGGTTNHAWSGGGLTLLSQYVAGIAPTSPAYGTFEVKPRMGPLKNVIAEVPSIKGMIRVETRKRDDFQMKLSVPEETTASVFIEDHHRMINLDGEKIDMDQLDSRDGYFILELEPGEHEVVAEIGE